MKMSLLVAAACLISAGGSGRPVASCEPLPPLCDSAARAHLVFFGEVLSVRTYAERTEGGQLPQGIQEVRFNVIRAFKGVKTGEAWGLYYFDSESAPFKTGARYLVFAERRLTGAFVTGCTPTRELSSADEDGWSRNGAAALQACFKRR